MYYLYIGAGLCRGAVGTVKVCSASFVALQLDGGKSPVPQVSRGALKLRVSVFDRACIAAGPVRHSAGIRRKKEKRRAQSRIYIISLSLSLCIYIHVYINIQIYLGPGPQGPREDPQGPGPQGPGPQGPMGAHKIPQGPAGAHKGPANSGPGGPTRARPTRAQGLHCAMALSGM